MCDCRLRFSICQLSLILSFTQQFNSSTATVKIFCLVLNVVTFIMKRFLVTSSENNKKCIKEAIDNPSPSSPGINESMAHIPSTSSTSAQEIDKITNNFLFYGTFYKVISIVDNKFTADCQLCNKTIRGQINSTGNFLNHIKNMHSSLLSKLQTKKNEKKKLSNASLSKKDESTLPDFSKKQLKLPYSQLFQPKQISKQTIVNLVFDYIIDEMRPLVTCEKVAFRNLIMGLTGITDAAYLPDSKVMKRELKSRYKSYVAQC
uniref:BED-type domain-containing protein n=1 Tax=Schizaphis graminum TaxID=13262 RepID=A0A2S2PEN5_SCHGA